MDAITAELILMLKREWDKAGIQERMNKGAGLEESLAKAISGQGRAP